MLISTIHRALGSKTAKPSDFSMAKGDATAAPDPSDGKTFVQHVKKALASVKPRSVLPPHMRRKKFKKAKPKSPQDEGK